MILAEPASEMAGSVLAQWGGFGAVLLALAWFAYKLFQRETKTLDLEREARLRAEARNDELNKSFREQIIPALTQSTAALNQSAEALGKVARVLRSDQR